MSFEVRCFLALLACTGGIGCSGVAVGEDGDGDGPCNAIAEEVTLEDISVPPPADFDRSPEELFARLEGSAEGELTLYEEIDGDWQYPGRQVPFRIDVRVLRDEVRYAAGIPDPEFPDVVCNGLLKADAEVDIDAGAELQVRHGSATLEIYSPMDSHLRLEVLEGFESDLTAFFEHNPIPGEEAGLRGYLRLDERDAWEVSLHFVAIRPCMPDDYMCNGVTEDNSSDSAILGKGTAQRELGTDP